MMVNQLNNNNSTPWQSTIPNQMPWLNSVPANTPMQFGQSYVSQNEPIIKPPQSDIPAHSTNLLSNASAGASVAGLVLPPDQTMTSMKPCLMFNNPFDPQQPVAAQQFNESTPTTSHHYSTINPSGSSIQVDPVLPTEPFASSFLTQLPSQQHGSPTCSFREQPLQQKRSSIEMEDEMTVKEAPPTKQQISENRLFKRFGSLQLDGERSVADDEIQDEDIITQDAEDGRMVDSSEEVNRYVYLLYKDKKSNNSSNALFDLLVKREQEAKNKAVIPWQPPLIRNYFVSEASDSDDDDDGISYKDHKDFLKDKEDNDSIIITEVEDDAEIEDAFPADDVMRD